MNAANQAGRPEQHHLFGEHASGWLAFAFALLGTLFAAALAWLWLTRAPASQPPTRASVEPTSVAAVESPAVPALAARSSAGDVGAGSATSGPGATAPGQPRAPAEGAARNVPVSDAGNGAQARVAATQAGSEPQAAIDCPTAIEIPFSHGSAKPSVGANAARFEALREFLNRHPRARVAVEGHADSVGSADFNLLLTYRRAKAVASLLSNAGISAQRISVRALGEDVPKSGMSADAGENRRVVVLLRDVEHCVQDSDEAKG